ncbi:hypothetical protein LP414_11090 [Polaromonas sp. P1(28)-13]|nr:hypothetical protein LP414_11090 [Polaromonas sp. P1(28)-13]
MGAAAEEPAPEIVSAEAAPACAKNKTAMKAVKIANKFFFMLESVIKKSRGV